MQLIIGVGYRLGTERGEKQEGQLRDRDAAMAQMEASRQVHHELLAVRCYRMRQLGFSFGIWGRHTAAARGAAAPREEVERILAQKKELQYTLSDEVEYAS